MSDAPVIVWFRQDLRLADNGALKAAAGTARPILACYVLDESVEWAPGAASRWWLHHSLISLARDLEKRGGRLVLRRGPAVDHIPALARAVGAGAVFASASPIPSGAARDCEVSRALDALGIKFQTLPGALLYGVDPVRAQSGEPYQVFTPFSKALLALSEPDAPEAEPGRLRFSDASVAYDDLEDWRLEPSQPNWAAGFESHWRPGEQGAHTRLEQFVAGAVADYAADRDRPDLAASTSGLSPHLAFGELSPRQLWHAARSAGAGRAGAAAGTDAWLRQLIWREFSYYLLHHWPDFPSTPFRASFARFPWAEDGEALMRWQNGITGYPFVDAGMRELWQTGWMHNRVRMVVASFLVKDLMLSWRQGAAWFWDTLVDADLANNSASWQWVAGSGADAAPYFRIFNPVTQGKKFDPDGAYVREYVPEIAALPDRYLHAPWKAPRTVLERAGIDLGIQYPEPIVDHAAARWRALQAYALVKRARA